jgi:AcrR family transcriptional regulator
MNNMTNARGRPRSFDIDVALDRGVEVFWKNGFQGTSLSELSSAMGLSKPSLYAAFGDKESLYLKALERYVNLLLELHADLLADEPDARRAVETFLHSIAEMLTNPILPGGCFIVNGTADCGCSSVPEKVELALRKALQGSETLIRKRLQRAQQDGQLSLNASPEELAAFFGSLISGLAVQAKSGAKEAKLHLVVDAAMAVWPQ